ncbi:cyanoexosortase A [Oxynema aestuarii]|jgi:cyanoexosortase A|uniref:Cyanoexosortase A n=1 Tax=Oxynema aestuarii AP17 TaxID=2064643 RepID=A0A6H1TTT7_9CYAN|nr:cyanoexosortase A [Oxynema aestuarii]QIZ70028.1 cyanoexosortase A [Oxynema aestuarii AP17]RMH74871.1 MAG: cyanoexosortase A [Cyanobacteria bacterium J007]
MNWSTTLQQPRSWLVAIGAGLITIHLTLTWRSDNIDVLGASFLFWGAAAFLLWERSKHLNLQSDLFSSLVGLGILTIVLLKSISISEYDIFLRVSPFLSAFGLALLASGFKGLKQYWQELLILSLISISTGLLLGIYDITPVTAKFSALLLWYMGFPVQRDGVLVQLPTGSIEVYSGCSGYGTMIQILGIAILFLFMFPTSLKQKFLLPLIAITLGFVVNGIRVALMGLLVAYSSREAFEYWHYGDGSLVFSLLGVFIFGLICWFFILRTPPDKEDSQQC